MNWKPRLLILSILVMFPLIVVSNPIIAGLSFASTLMGLTELSEDLLEEIFDNSYERASDALVAVQEMHNDVQYRLGEISNMLTELPLIINQRDMHNNLQEHVNHVDEHERVKITWEGVKSIDLTSTKLEKEYLVVGLSFMLSKTNNKRISLATYACQFLFHMGKNLCPYREHLLTHFRESPEDELVLQNVDVPTASSRANKPNSADAQFLTFTLTSERKDGAQTTVPFIDTQELVTNPPVPLRGVGLMYRGQPGFGGFLALKIYTYNVTHHIPDFPKETGIIDVHKIITTEQSIPAGSASEHDDSHH